MKKYLFSLAAASLALASYSPATKAMGGSDDLPDEIILKDVAEGLAEDSNISGSRALFQRAKVITAEQLAPNTQYNCLSFSTLPNQASGSPDIYSPSYKFKTYGLFVKNKLEHAMVEMFGTNPIYGDEFMGKSKRLGQDYFEVIRMLDDGSIIVEGFASLRSWYATALGVVGLKDAAIRATKFFKDYAMTSVTRNKDKDSPAGYTSRYVYCPFDEASAADGGNNGGGDNGGFEPEEPVVTDPIVVEPGEDNDTGLINEGTNP